MLLCDKNAIRTEGKSRIEKLTSLAALSTVSTVEGKIRGVSESGKPMAAIIRGKSKARILMEAEEQKRRTLLEKQRLEKLENLKKGKKSPRPIIRGD